MEPFCPGFSPALLTALRQSQNLAVFSGAGISAESGIYFVGLPNLVNRASSFIYGVWHDAKYIADHIVLQNAYMAYDKA